MFKTPFNMVCFIYTAYVCFFNYGMYIKKNQFVTFHFPHEA